MLKTPQEVIKALGGNKNLANELGVKSSAVSNWKRDGFPASKHYQLYQLCKTNGLSVDTALFGGESINDIDANDVYDELLTAFIQAGYKKLDMPILQPSAPFIKQLGVRLQNRLYRFTDPGGEEMCLRPDLTIPTALKYIESQASGRQRYCYKGTAFRYQPEGTDKPEEFTQAGIEILGGKTGTDAIEDDIEVLDTLVQVIKKAGVKDFTIAVANAYSGIPRASIDPEILEYEDENGMIAGRSTQDINERLKKQRDETQDMKEKMNQWIERAAEKINLDAEKFKPKPTATDNFNYYTGLNFEIQAPTLGEEKQVIASGGRYDDLLQSLDTNTSMPAIGGAIALERLEAASERAAA